MKILLIHSAGFAWKVNEKALKNAEPLNDNIKSEFKTSESVLLAFTAIEASDIKNKDGIISKFYEEINQALKDISEDKLIIYPWVHLSEDPASPKDGLNVLNSILAELEDKLTVKLLIRAPFGYYKSFSLNCKGHPLAERSKNIMIDKEDSIDEGKVESVAALDAEEKSKSEFYIYSNETDLTPINEFNFSNWKETKIFVNYETKKDRSAPKAPEHVRYLKELELVDYEEGSDAGNFRILPKGYIMKQLLELHVTNMAREVDSFIVETPLMYDYNHESLKKYLERFPARQYVVKSGSNNYFLRFAACFGQFLTLANSNISYRNLPLKIFEMAKSFRREQRGELAGLRRLRAFTMPDLHTVAIDLDQAKESFEEQFKLAKQYMEDIDISFETAFRMTNAFYDENKEWIHSLVKTLNKPVMIELFDRRYAYFVLKFEFNVVDTQSKAAALSTVQIDVENSERFNIQYVNDKGEKEFPLLLHCSISGSTERVIYAILEDQIKKMKKGKKGQIPLWLSPVQIRILPVSSDQIDHSINYAEQIKKLGYRVEVDDRDMSLGKRIRSAEKSWVPLIAVVGAKEIEDNKLNLRFRSKKETEVLSLEELVNYLKEKTKNNPQFPPSYPIRVSKQPIFTRIV